MSQFSQLSNDPKITAFVLGELEGEELAQMEAAIASDSLLASEVNAIRKASIALRHEFQKETQYRLAPAHRARVLDVGKAAQRLWIWRFKPLIVAMTVVMAVGVFLRTREAVNTEIENSMDTLGGRIDSAMPESRDKSQSANEGIAFKSGHLDSVEGFQGNQVFNTEEYNRTNDGEFIRVADEALSTFSIDVDTGSYSNIRRYLKSGSLPPVDAVRIEEMINYFSYKYADAPADGKIPFSVDMEMAESPWTKNTRLVRIALQAKRVPESQRPRANLVFLIDVSGSMADENKLPFLVKSLARLVNHLNDGDRISIVTYAGHSGVVLKSVRGSEKSKILSALQVLRSGGGTNGAAGIEDAYDLAEENFIKGGINRVILGTDGDFNVGRTGQGNLTRLIEEKAKTGVFLNTIGFGMGNYKDGTMEQLADKGNGVYSYIDSDEEAEKIFDHDFMGTLMTVAKDVKLQVEFNPAQVEAYRLIGYANRALAKQDFNNDKKDAGELGSGHSVTAFYEVLPKGEKLKGASVDQLKYQKVEKADAKPVAKDGVSNEVLTVKVRYKLPDQDVSEKAEFPLALQNQEFKSASVDFRFAAAVASFGMKLRSVEGAPSYDWITDVASSAKGDGYARYREEFIDLVRSTKKLRK